MTISTTDKIKAMRAALETERATLAAQGYQQGAAAITDLLETGPDESFLRLRDILANA